MIQSRLINSLLISAAVLASVSLQGQDCDCYPPKPSTLVVDLENILTPLEEDMLNKRLIDLNDRTSNQVVIVTIDKLCAGDAAMTAYEIGACWGVGQKEFDNGLVILIKPTGGVGERKTFIAVGYGLEGIIPDATAKLIVDQEMIPNFRGNNYYAGLDKAIDVISELATKEYSYADYNKAKSSGSGFLALIPILFVLLIWFLLTYKRTRTYANRNDLGFWAALMLMNASRRSHSGSWGGFSGGGGFGGGGGGGFGGGGFGGFGGGGFGGGGAGGSW